MRFSGGWTTFQLYWEYIEVDWDETTQYDMENDK